MTIAFYEHPFSSYVQSIGGIGFVVWAHHMYTVGMTAGAQAYAISRK